ncbi:MAG TPA: sigma-70 family RNA polymerase sigma factor [Blastocatellia bacterium]|jgi:RNA polymerase sigma factor (TIGR02999 family)|nr:sigma-70 family RNA polymerase sigma factor [Blastocatellia bacterium]
MGVSSQITELIADWRGGREGAFDQLFALVYDELRSLASGYMKRERPDHTLQTTALVNEAYLKLVGHKDSLLENRLHFFAVAARVMRQILIDHARMRHKQKRGGKAIKISLDEAMIMPDERASDLLALDDALKELAAIDERKSRVVELRFFGGMTIEETAEFLGVSFNTVVRDWDMARAWLYRNIHGDGDES